MAESQNLQMQLSVESDVLTRICYTAMASVRIWFQTVCTTINNDTAIMAA